MIEMWEAKLFLNTPYMDERDIIFAPRSSYSNAALNNDLKGLKRAWKRFQRRRNRDAVYPFLSEVFKLVAWWDVERDANRRAIRMLRRCNIAIPEKIEPFGAVIVAAAAPTVLDRRLVSKWSRVLRYAASFKPPSEGLSAFLQRQGGLNACAAHYARRIGRWGR